MGIAFRSNEYHRFVRLGGRTIKDGEAAAIWDRNGVHTQVIGPKRIFLFYSTIRFLNHYNAGKDQYLQITHRDGSVTNVNGPTSVYQNPCWHNSIEIKNGILLRSCNEKLVISYSNSIEQRKHCYDNAEETESSSSDAEQQQKRVRIIQGPCIFRPTKDEYIHTFEWTDPGASSWQNGDVESFSGDFHSKKVMAFNAIQVQTPTVLTITVPVTTLDFVKFGVHCSFTYSVEDLLKCLKIFDPIELILNGIQSDIQNICHSIQSQDLKSKPSEVADSIKNCDFEKSKSFAARCGFDFASVTILDLKLNKTLQAQIDQEKKREILASTEITTKQSKLELQELDFMERQKKLEHDTEIKRNKSKLESKVAEEAFTEKIASIERETEIARKIHIANEELARMSNENTLLFLRGLQDAGVNLTELLCSKTNNTDDYLLQNLGRSSKVDLFNNGKENSKKAGD